MSEKQIVANQRNGQKSTGPKTLVGKSASKMNALKHGLLAKQLLVRGRKLKESAREFKDFYAEFYADLAPVGSLEEMLAEEILAATWRLRRVRAAESAEIALSVDTAGKDPDDSDPTIQWIVWRSALNPVHSMMQSSIGIQMLIGQLRTLREAVEKEGELTQAAIDNFLGCEKPDPISFQLGKFRAWYLENPEGIDASALRDKHREQVQLFIERKLSDLRWSMDEREERERIERTVEEAAAMLPSHEQLEKILRYEGALQRQRDRAMHQLERLQRRRQGELVPPPVTMEISARS